MNYLSQKFPSIFTPHDEMEENTPVSTNPDSTRVKRKRQRVANDGKTTGGPPADTSKPDSTNYSHATSEAVPEARVQPDASNRTSPATGSLAGKIRFHDLSLRELQDTLRRSHGVPLCQAFALAINDHGVGAAEVETAMVDLENYNEEVKKALETIEVVGEQLELTRNELHQAFRILRDQLATVVSDEDVMPHRDGA